MVNPTVLWLIAGGIFCCLELVFPTAFVSFMMGVAAFIVAIISLVFPNHSLLMGLWLILATGLTLTSRRFFTPKRSKVLTGDDTQAIAVSGIPAGSVGRVLYEGNSWQAKCADETRDIAPNEPLYIVRRQGNTLIVLPSQMLDID
ncbi:hypothetical protein NIES4102_11990 [Chondrocystis sp. NIES-4102]|nr:hypothetical protein NIES4102_11990 [Chondrocystis sp. NIES-4102]